MRQIPRVVPAFSHWLTHPPHGRSLDIFELQDILWYNEYILGILDILALLDQSFLTQFSVMSREMHGWYFPEYFLIWLCHISTWPTSPSWHGLDTPHPRTWIYKFDEYLDLFWDIIIIFDDVISHAPWPVLLDLDRPNPRKQDNFPSYIQITRYMQE